MGQTKGGKCQHHCSCENNPLRSDTVNQKATERQNDGRYHGRRQEPEACLERSQPPQLLQEEWQQELRPKEGNLQDPQDHIACGEVPVLEKTYVQQRRLRL